MKTPLPPFWQSTRIKAQYDLRLLEGLECIPVGKVDCATAFLRRVQHPKTSRSRPQPYALFQRKNKYLSPLLQSLWLSSHQRCWVKECLTACALVFMSGFYVSLFAQRTKSLLWVQAIRLASLFLLDVLFHRSSFSFRQIDLHWGRPLAVQICPNPSLSSDGRPYSTPSSPSTGGSGGRGVRREALDNQLCGLNIQAFAEPAGRRPYSPLHRRNHLLGLKFFVICFFHLRPHLPVSV